MKDKRRKQGSKIGDVSLIMLISIEELIKANIGKEAIITYGDKTIKGRIKSVPENREIEKDAVRPVSSAYYSTYLQPPTGGDCHRRYRRRRSSIK